MTHPPGALTTGTVLFTDVVDSTATRIRLGEEVADRLFARHDRQLRAVVRVNRVRLVRSVGDGIMAVFDSATAALRAATAIQQAVAADNRRNPVAVEIRTGLSTGDILWTADDIQGLPPVEAARLASTAQAGQILCSDMCMRLALGRADLEFKELGLLDLKGLDQPLRTFDVLWRDEAPSPAARLPVWLRHDEALPFAGRARELAILRDWLDDPPPGASVAVVSGDAGAGKTRLVAEVVERALEHRQVVFVGRCTEPATRPFQPLAEAIERVASVTPAVLLQAEPESTLSELVRLCPELAEPPFMFSLPSLADPETQYFRLIDGLTRLLDGLSAVSPVVIVLDDLQWATDATVRILLAVLRQLDAGSVQVIATIREGEIDVGNEVAHHLRALLAFPSIIRLSLGPMSRRDIAQVLLATTDTVGDDADVLADRVVAATGGNAFLVSETVRALGSGADLPAFALPEAITLFIAGRVDRAGPTARELIHVLACADRLEPAVLRAATEASEAEFVAALDEALDTGLVIEHSDGLLGVAHDLARGAVTAGQSPARQTMMHRRIASALVAVHPGISSSQPYLLARHLDAVAEAGTDDDIAQARDAAEQAAAHAMVRLAHHEAVTWYERSLALHDRLGEVESGRRVELLLELAEAQARAGSRQARATRIQAGRRAVAVGRDDLVVSAALCGDRGFFSLTAHADTELIELLSTALTLVGPTELTTRAELLAALASELTWAADGDGRFALSDEALDLARRSGDDRTLVRVLVLRSLTISAADTLAQRLDDSEELVRVAEGTADDVLRFHAAFQRTAALLDLGDTRGIARGLTEARRLADELGQPQLRWLVEFSEAGLTLMRGDLVAAEQSAERALRLGVEAGRRLEAMAFYSEQLAEVRRLQGRLDELVPGMRAAAGHLLVDPVNAVMRYLCDAGADEVEEMFDQAVAARGVPPRRDMAQRAALDNLACVAARIDRRDVMPLLYEALAPHADTFGHSAVAHPCGHHYLGALAAGLGWAEAASAHYAAAAVAHERAETPLLHAESLLDWSEHLAATGGPRAQVAELRDRAATALAGRTVPKLTIRLAEHGD
jgi:class 3 adenylate cyclase